VLYISIKVQCLRTPSSCLVVTDDGAAAREMSAKAASIPMDDTEILDAKSAVRLPLSSICTDTIRWLTCAYS
jgi:hypothetical protein